MYSFVSSKPLYWIFFTPFGMIICHILWHFWNRYDLVRCFEGNRYDNGLVGFRRLRDLSGQSKLLPEGAAPGAHEEAPFKSYSKSQPPQPSGIGECVCDTESLECSIVLEKFCRSFPSCSMFFHLELQNGPEWIQGDSLFTHILILHLPLKYLIAYDQRSLH